MKARIAIIAALLAMTLHQSPSVSAPRRQGVRNLASTPAAFVDQLYSYFRDDQSQPRDETGVWTPSMLALMARLDRLDDETRLEVSDGDEICQCQDWGDFKLLSRRVLFQGPRRADAFVRFRNFGEVSELRLVLEWTPAGWRVADIFAPDRPGGLAAAYRKALASRLSR